MVRTRRVLAVPGRPVIRQWPPTNRLIMICSKTSSWPTMTRRTCVTISLCTWRKRAMRDLRASGSNCVADDMFCPFLILDCGCAQLQQKLLRGAEPRGRFESGQQFFLCLFVLFGGVIGPGGSEEHTSELQSPCNLVCRLLLEKKKKTQYEADNYSPLNTDDAVH